MPNLAATYRPKRFDEVVGQENEVEVLVKMITDGWRPPALMFSGPYGTGKTSLARLVSRALLCKARTEHEPCNNCESCTAMDNDNHYAYLEKDAASEGSVADARRLKDEIQYRVAGELKILNFDEAHMLSDQAQDAMLKVTEEGQQGVLFMYATTDAPKMKPTLRSRCIELQMKLLSAGKVYTRLARICETEGIKFDEKALRIMATYVRGHMRDALNLLEQVSRMNDYVTEDLVRAYLRIDRFVEIYEFLCLKDQKEAFAKLEELLCNYAPSELQEAVGQTLINAYKERIGLGDFAQVDKAWLKKVAEAKRDNLLDQAEQILSLSTDFATINYGMAALGKILIGQPESPITMMRSMPAAAHASAAPGAGVAVPWRKPGKPMV